MKAWRVLSITRKMTYNVNILTWLEEKLIALPAKNVTYLSYFLPDHVVQNDNSLFQIFYVPPQ